MGCCKHGGTDGDCLDCLRDEVAELRGALYDEHHGISFHARDAELQRLTAIEAAARNLVAQKGRHNTEIAYRRLVEALTPNVGGNRRPEAAGRREPAGVAGRASG